MFYKNQNFENEMKGFEYLTRYFCLEKSSFIYYKSKFTKFSKTYGMRRKENVRIIIVCTKNHVTMRSAAWITWWQPLISIERFFRGWNLLRARLFFRALALIYSRLFALDQRNSNKIRLSDIDIDEVLTGLVILDFVP